MLNNLSPSGSMKNHLISICLSIIFVSILGIIRLNSFKKQPNPSWQAYKNEKYHFEVKYDQKLQVNEIFNKGQQLTFITFGNPKDDKSFDIEISKGDKIEYYKYQISEYGDSSLVKEEKFYFDGIEATMLVYNRILSANSVSFSKAIIKNNNLDYIITAKTCNFPDIISTFKFTNLNSAPNTSSWQTYKNDQYGFEFKYPITMDLKPKNANDKYYVDLINLSQDNQLIDIKAISNIDVYNHASPKDVAFREITDLSEISYTIDGVNVNSLEITRSIAKESPETQIFIIAHPKKNLFINIKFQNSPQTTINQILSTFKFTDSKVTWQTYKNDQYGFEFQYPSKYSKAEINEWIKDPLLILDNKSNTQKLSKMPNISVRHLDLKSNQFFESVLINDVVFDGSGLSPKSFSEFKKIHLGNNNFYFIETGLFEGILSINYYLISRNQIFVFTVVSSPVDWTNPNFKPEDDPINKDLQQILSTFKFTDSKIEKQIGYINKAYIQNGQPTVDVDSVEWLTGQEGTKACIEDGQCYDCPPENDCLPNGYYIRNRDATIQTLILDPQSQIEILNLENMSNEPISFDEFKKFIISKKKVDGFLHNNLFWLTTKENKIIKVLPQYQP